MTKLQGLLNRLVVGLQLGRRSEVLRQGRLIVPRRMVRESTPEHGLDVIRVNGECLLRVLLRFLVFTEFQQGGGAVAVENVVFAVLINGHGIVQDGLGVFAGSKRFVPFLFERFCCGRGIVVVGRFDRLGRNEIVVERRDELEFFRRGIANRDGTVLEIVTDRTVCHSTIIITGHGNAQLLTSGMQNPIGRGVVRCGMDNMEIGTLIGLNGWHCGMYRQIDMVALVQFNTSRNNLAFDPQVHMLHVFAKDFDHSQNRFPVRLTGGFVDCILGIVRIRFVGCCGQYGCGGCQETQIGRENHRGVRALGNPHDTLLGSQIGACHANCAGRCFLLCTVVLRNGINELVFAFPKGIELRFGLCGFLLFGPFFCFCLGSSVFAVESELYNNNNSMKDAVSIL